MSKKTLLEEIVIHERNIPYNRNLDDSQIVIVEQTKNQCLTFMVSKGEELLVPGFPACSLKYYTTTNKAKKDIINTYLKLGKIPPEENKILIYRGKLYKGE